MEHQLFERLEWIEGYAHVTAVTYSTESALTWQPCIKTMCRKLPNYYYLDAANVRSLTLKEYERDTAATESRALYRSLVNLLTGKYPPKSQARRPRDWDLIERALKNRGRQVIIIDSSHLLFPATLSSIASLET
jgi:hypothetical protein